MTMNLSVNAHGARVASVAEFRQALTPFASDQFRDICVKVDHGGPALFALLNGDIGWLMYLRHDDGDAGFSSRNPAFDASAAVPGGPVAVVEYRLSNGQLDQYPASWALPEQEVMRALEYFVEQDGARAPFVSWHDDAQC